MNTPQISVLMPVYNSERFLSDAVQSILDQTFADFEFLIIDDGSTDDSRRILQDFAARDSRIRLICRGNTGYVVALNEMLGLARGEFLARMDADDVSYPHRFKVQVAFLREHGDVACVGAYVDFIDSESRFLRVESTAHENEDIQSRLLRGECPICHPAVMMRAESVRRVDGYRAEFQPAEDRDLWLRLGEVSELRNVPRRLLRYRLHSGSVSERHRQQQIEKMHDACEQAWRRRGVAGQFTAKVNFRPAPTRESRFRCRLRYGWWAFQSGERRTAASYAAAAVRMMPWRPEGWKLLAVCGIKPCGLKPEPADDAADSLLSPTSGSER